MFFSQSVTQYLSHLIFLHGLKKYAKGNYDLTQLFILIISTKILQQKKNKKYTLLNLTCVLQ